MADAGTTSRQLLRSHSRNFARATINLAVECAHRRNHNLLFRTLFRSASDGPRAGSERAARARNGKSNQKPKLVTASIDERNLGFPSKNEKHFPELRGRMNVISSMRGDGLPARSADAVCTRGRQHARRAQGDALPPSFRRAPMPPHRTKFLCVVRLLRAPISPSGISMSAGEHQCRFRRRAAFARRKQAGHGERRSFPVGRHGRN